MHKHRTKIFEELVLMAVILNKQKHKQSVCINSQYHLIRSKCTWSLTAICCTPTSTAMPKPYLLGTLCISVAVTEGYVHFKSKLMCPQIPYQNYTHTHIHIPRKKIIVFSTHTHTQKVALSVHGPPQRVCCLVWHNNPLPLPVLCRVIL